MLLTVDMDGVLCEGNYLPPEKRSYKAYVNQPLKLRALEALRKNEIPFYILSARESFKFPFQCTLDQLNWWKDMPNLKGVMTGVPSVRKLEVASALGAVYHLDDDANTFISWNKDIHSTKPVLVNSYNLELLEDSSFKDAVIWDEINGDLIEYLLGSVK